MSGQCNSEGVAEFIRLVEELKDFTEGMSNYERKFVEDCFVSVENLGDKSIITETQLDFIRELYKRIL